MIQQSAQRKTLVTSRELVAMQIAFVATDVFLTYPQFTQYVALEAAWMIPLLSGLLALVVFLFVNWIIKRRFPNMDIVEIATSAFGSAVGSVVALVFSMYFLVYMATVMRLFMENVISTVLPNTPFFLVGALFTATAAYVAYLGFEPICRAAYLFLPVMLVGVPLLCLLTAHWWHADYLWPLWGRGLVPVFRGTLLSWSIYINVLFLVILYPHAKNPGMMGTMGVTSILAADAILTGFLLVYSMVFPPLEAQNISFPFYQLARLIYLGRFFQRLESLFIFLWVIMAVVRISILLWASVYLMSRAFQWPVSRPAIPATALLGFALSLIPPTILQMQSFSQNYLLPWGSLIVFGLPVLITVSAAVFKRRPANDGRGDRGLQRA